MAVFFQGYQSRMALPYSPKRPVDIIPWARKRRAYFSMFCLAYGSPAGNPGHVIEQNRLQHKY